jgi:hypothetical protein
MGNSIGSLLQTVAPIAGAIIAPELLPEIGLLNATADAAIGAGIGGLASGGGIKGALEDAALAGSGAGVVNNLGDIVSGVSDALGSGSSAAGSSGASGASGASTATTAAEPVAVGGKGTSAISGAGSITGDAGDAQLLNNAKGAQAATQGAFQTPSAALNEQVAGLTKADQGLLDSAQNAAVSAPSTGKIAADVGSAASKSSGGLLSGLLSGKNSNLLLPAAELALSAAKSNQSIPGQGALTDIANQQSKVGTNLASSLSTGALPAGAQAQIDQSVASQIAQIRSKYAQMGLSGSSMENQDIAAVQRSAQEQAYTAASNATNTGLTALNNASATTQTIANQKLQQDQELQNAINSMASGFGLNEALSRNG